MHAAACIVPLLPAVGLALSCAPASTSTADWCPLYEEHACLTACSLDCCLPLLVTHCSVLHCCPALPFLAAAQRQHAAAQLLASCWLPTVLLVTHGRPTGPHKACSAGAPWGVGTASPSAGSGPPYKPEQAAGAAGCAGTPAWGPDPWCADSRAGGSAGAGLCQAAVRWAGSGGSRGGTCTHNLCRVVVVPEWACVIPRVVQGAI